jgi:DNA-binding transcriptional LysR family regulator
MLDLYKLKIFAAVVQAGSFSAAAEQLYITQSAVSQHMKDLEASLGQSLFQRGWRGVSLTSEGEILARYTRQIFELVAQAEASLTNVAQLAAGKISIGTTQGIGIYLAPDWVQRFRGKYPQLTVGLQTGPVNQIAVDILGHRLDIGVIEGELEDHYPTKLTQLILEEIEQVVVVGTSHPFAGEDHLQVTDLNRQSFIVRQQHSQSRIWLNQILDHYGVEPMIGAEFDNLESMKRTLTVGRCLAVLPRYVVKAEVEQGILHAIPVDGQPFSRSLKLIWDNEMPFSPITHAFLTELSQLYPSLQSLLS